jgi:hypothetical protein
MRVVELVVSHVEFFNADYGTLAISPRVASVHLLGVSVFLRNENLVFHGLDYDVGSAQ